MTPSDPKSCDELRESSRYGGDDGPSVSEGKRFAKIVEKLVRVRRKRLELRNQWEGGERCAHSADLRIGRGLSGLVIFYHVQEPEIGGEGRL